MLDPTVELSNYQIFNSINELKFPNSYLLHYPKRAKTDYPCNIYFGFPLFGAFKETKIKVVGAIYFIHGQENVL